MRSAMREGIVDQRLARLQGRGSERERTESHRHHPIQPPFVHPRPHLSSKPTPAIPSSLVPAAPCLPPFLSCRLFLSLPGPLPVVSFSRHSYLAILETQPRVCPCAYVFVVFVRLYTRPLLYTCTARASVCRVRPSWNMYIIDMYTYVKCQSKRIRRGTSMSEHNTGCGIQAELLFHSTRRYSQATRRESRGPDSHTVSTVFFPIEM